ncbi:hypothetical protein FNI11_03450 [Salmonella enterica subsp. salamae]|nr:hypothetical protein [Salmonella enterica subsp. salamae]ECJ2279981.1 hypothetical protein [Salmonella enterica subsp. salamae]
MRDILVPHRRQPSAVQIRSGRICHCIAAFLQLELFRVYMPGIRISVEFKGGLPLFNPSYERTLQ